jgi:hypothetical protein
VKPVIVLNGLVVCLALLTGSFLFSHPAISTSPVLHGVFIASVISCVILTVVVLTRQAARTFHRMSIAPGEWTGHPGRS